MGMTTATICCANTDGTDLRLYGRLPDQSLLVAGEGVGGKMQGAKLLTSAYRDSHYRKFYFHNAGPEVERKCDFYPQRR